MELLLLIAVALTGFLLLYGYHPVLRYRYRHLPGPDGQAFVGNLLQMKR